MAGWTETRLEPPARDLADELRARLDGVSASPTFDLDEHLARVAMVVARAREMARAPLTPLRAGEESECR